MHTAGVNLPSLCGLSGPQTPPKQPPLGLCMAKGMRTGVEMCPGWGDNGIRQGTFSRGRLAKSPLRAAEGHRDGLHSLLELPLVRLIVGFVMETWE